MSDLKVIRECAAAVIKQNLSDGIDESSWIDAEDVRIENLTQADIDFLVACNPKAIMSVLSQLDAVRNEAERLWVLLDDISTAGDVFKPEIDGYFKYVNKIADKRNGIITSDGYTLIWKQALGEK